MQLIELSNSVKAGKPARASLSGLDFIVLAIILLMGAIQFVYYPHASDFLNDPGYPDLAQSILEHGTYDFDSLPETTLPPGLPLILALAGRFFGLGPAVEFHVLALFTTLSMITAYFLLRRLEGRGVAAAGCLLLGAAPSFFGFNTALIFPEMPYFFASMLALLLAVNVDHAPKNRSLVAWELALSLVIAAAILIRSIGVALLAGICAWTVLSLVTDPQCGRRRLRRFLLPLAIGAATQAGWSIWAGRHQVLEWSLPGYPESYVAQLKVKNGQYPELGYTSLSDIPTRIEKNVTERATVLCGLLTRRHVSMFWASPAVAGVVGLILLGVAWSICNSSGLQDWYYLAYEGIFILWPWDIRERFLYPVVPLAVLYLWRGVKACGFYASRKPKLMGLSLLLVGAGLSLCSGAFSLHLMTFHLDGAYARGDRLQPIAAAAFWALVATAGFLLFRFGSMRDGPGKQWPAVVYRVPKYSVAALRIAGFVVLTWLVGSGVAQQAYWAPANLHPDPANQFSYPEIAASNWIRSHEPADRIVMARDQDTVFHYTARRVVWFPPISNPDTLMAGIRRHHVRIVIVARHPTSYWLPTEAACFQSLLRIYGNSFSLVNAGRDYQVWEVAQAA